MNQASLKMPAILSLAALLHVSAAFAQIPLGTANSFGVLAGSTVTNTGPTTVDGNVGVSAGNAVTGFPPGLVTGGAIHAADATSAQGQVDLTVAYNIAGGTACGTDLTGQDLGGLTLTPGVYCFDTSAQLTGTLTLDMQGDPDAYFLFKIGSTLTTASASSVVLINNAASTCPANVFWRVGSSATLGTGSTFRGNILALTSITMNTGTAVSGRALARNGAVTLDTNSIDTCTSSVVCPVITLNPVTLPSGVVGIPYSRTITASGATASSTFIVTDGALPNGLTLNPVTGVLSGTPTTVGTFTFTISATSSAFCIGSRPYTVNIAATVAPAVPALDYAGLALLITALGIAALFVIRK